jgi:hypothetical protein
MILLRIGSGILAVACFPLIMLAVERASVLYAENRNYVEFTLCFTWFCIGPVVMVILGVYAIGLT